MSAPASKVDVLAVLTPGEGKIIEPSAWRYKDAVITRTPSAPAAPTAPESATYEQTWRTRYQTLLFCLEDRPRIALVDAAALEAARAAVAELIEAAREDASMMTSITLDYRHDRKADEPEGAEWWTFKREQLRAAGYEMACEAYDGSELFYKADATPRLRAALDRFGATP